MDQPVAVMLSVGNGQSVVSLSLVLDPRVVTLIPSRNRLRERDHNANMTGRGRIGIRLSWSLDFPLRSSASVVRTDGAHLNQPARRCCSR